MIAVPRLPIMQQSARQLSKEVSQRGSDFVSSFYPSRVQLLLRMVVLDGVPSPSVEFLKPPHATSFMSLLGDVGLLTNGNGVEKGSPRCGSLVRIWPFAYSGHCALFCIFACLVHQGCAGVSDVERFSMYELWAVERLYLKHIVLGKKRRGRSPRVAIAGCSFVQTVSLLRLSRSYFRCTP